MFESLNVERYQWFNDLKFDLKFESWMVECFNIGDDWIFECLNVWMIRM